MIFLKNKIKFSNLLYQIKNEKFYFTKFYFKFILSSIYSKFKLQKMN